MTVGERIKYVREKKAISQIDLANACNIKKQTLYKYENGIITNIPSDKIEAIADFLGVTPAYIMGWNENTDDLDREILRRIPNFISGEKRLSKASSHEKTDATDKTTNIEEQLKLLILARCKSIRAFTKEIDIPYSTLDTIFKRGISGASVKTVIKIFQALDLDIESITKGELIFKSDKYHSHIRDLRLEKGFPIKGVADALEIPVELYEKYESDEIVPDERTIFYIANFFGCSINYVLGKSDSKEVSEETDSLDEFFEDDHLITENGNYSRAFLSPDEFDHIKKYRALSERGKNVVDSILNNEYEWSQTTNKNE